MIASDAPQDYTVRTVSELLGVPRRRLRAMVRDGLLTPSQDSDGRLRFSFRDVVLVRRAKELADAGVPPRRIRRALRLLRERLPEGRSLSEIAIQSAGSRVLVRDSSGLFEAESGQAELELVAEPTAAADGPPRSALELPGRPGHVGGFASQRGGPVQPPPTDEEDPDELFNLGIDLEAVSAESAREAYERVLAIRPEHADARANLGRLLHEQGDVQGAERHYRAALESEPDNVTAAFNLGVALEDLGRDALAVEAYERALRSDPTYAPAHFNLSRLFERQGKRDAALRHLADYRRVTRG